jgi:hypothetical protein
MKLATHLQLVARTRMTANLHSPISYDSQVCDHVTTLTNLSFYYSTGDVETLVVEK